MSVLPVLLTQGVDAVAVGAAAGGLRQRQAVERVVVVVLWVHAAFVAQCHEVAEAVVERMGPSLVFCIKIEKLH